MRSDVVTLDSLLGSPGYYRSDELVQSSVSDDDDLRFSILHLISLIRQHSRHELVPNPNKNGSMTL